MMYFIQIVNPAEACVRFISNFSNYAHMLFFSAVFNKEQLFSVS